jgi:putative NIF3 family GTP cyclohydrolase 1 type 2
MKDRDISRRSFVFGGAGLAASIVIAQTAKPGLNAGQIINRIKTNVGIPWREQTVDRIIAGNADSPVRGIATTMMSTLGVMQRAAAAGKNMVITHEPTYYSHLDTVEDLTKDATYQYKLDFIEKNSMIVFRFHDHWHARHPDGIATGMARELGWEKNADPENPRLFSFPAASLKHLAEDIKARLHIRSVRVVGDPDLPVTRAIANWGYAGQLPGISLLARSDVDALIAGEAREWEVVEYTQDMISSGRKKALILLGHVVSEQAGMKYCAEWLKAFVPEVDVEFVPAAEPFWTV